jgi:hypothetical protein
VFVIVGGSDHVMECCARDLSPLKDFCFRNCRRSQSDLGVTSGGQIKKSIIFLQLQINRSILSSSFLGLHNKDNGDHNDESNIMSNRLVFHFDLALKKDLNDRKGSFAYCLPQKAKPV